MADAGFPFKVEEIFFLCFTVSGKGQEELFQRLPGRTILQYGVNFCPVTGGQHHGFFYAFLFIQMAKTAPCAFF